MIYSEVVVWSFMNKKRAEASRALIYSRMRLGYFYRYMLAYKHLCGRFLLLMASSNLQEVQGKSYCTINRSSLFARR